MKRRDARRSAAELYGTLGRIGLIVGSAGNVSIRTRRGMIVTPSGGSPDGVGARDLAEVTLDGDVTGNATPSSEWPMHAAVYRTAPEAECIIHTHADACTALACLNEPLPAFHYMVVQFGGTSVPCAPYVTFGTPELAALAGETIQGHSACLLANHGMIALGASLERALDLTVEVEELARQYALALMSGTPVLLSPAELDEALERFKTYGAGDGQDP